MSEMEIENNQEAASQIAMETLVTLNEYSEVLESLCMEASELVGHPEYQGRFLKLIEGISTFTDSITQVKTVLKTDAEGSVKLLESDLASILTDLLDSQEKKNSEYERKLLNTHLPQNLIQWRTTGIPAIRQTKDC
jgi:hypothetical protein